MVRKTATAGLSDTEQETRRAARYTKEQLLTAGAFVGREDILSAVWGEAETMTKAEAEKRISKFLKRGVE